MRHLIPLSALLLVLSLPTAHAQTPTPAFPELEPLTIENAARLVQLPGELTEVSEGFDVSPDGNQVAVARPDGVYLYDMGTFETPEKIFEVSGADKVYAPGFSPDNKQLMVTFFGADTEGSITRLWNINSDTVVQEFRTNPWPLNGGANFSPDGRFLAGFDTLFYTCPGACDPGSSLHVWTADEQATLLCGYYDCHGRYGIGDFEFTPDSKTLLWSAFDFPGGEIERGQYYWQAVDLIPDEIESYGENTADIPSGLEQHFRDRTGPFAGDIDSISFSPDGSTLVARNREQKRGSLWDVESGMEILSLPEGNRIRGFLQSDVVLIFDEPHQTTSILNIKTGEQVTLFDNLNDNEFISPANLEGKLLVSWDNFETLYFYGVPSESE